MAGSLINTAVALPWALAVVLSLLCAWQLVYYYYYKGTRSSKPGPARWPIIGHLHLLISSDGGDLLHVKLSRLADQYGPSIMFLQLGMRPMLVVSDPDVARQCFTTHDHAFASKPRLTAGEILGYNFTLIPWAPYDSHLRYARKICSLELLSPASLRRLAYIRDEETCNLVKELRNRATSAAVVGMRDSMTGLLIHIILRMMGIGRYDEEQVNEFKELIEKAFYYAGVRMLGDVLPYLWWLDLFRASRRAMTRIAMRMDSIVQSWIDERRSSSEGYENEDGDFMDTIMAVADKELSNSTTDHKDGFMKAMLLSMILGTMDTTSVALEWTLSELLNHPHALRKAQEELQAKIGHERKIQESDIEDLPYLQAVIKEALRLHPSGPLLVPHESTQDCVVAGFDVPSGTLLLVNAWKIHRDPRWWDRPLQFEPERFLGGGHGSASHLDMRGAQHFQLIPFGAGRRACPGSSLALSIIRLTIARLLQSFELKVPLHSPCVDMTEGSGFSCPKAVPLEVLLIPKDPSQLYV